MGISWAGGGRVVVSTEHWGKGVLGKGGGLRGGGLFGMAALRGVFKVL